MNAANDNPEDDVLMYVLKQACNSAEHLHEYLEITRRAPKERAYIGRILTALWQTASDLGYETHDRERDEEGYTHREWHHIGAPV